MKKWVEFDLKIINRVSIFQDFFYHKQGQGFKVRAAPPYPNLGQEDPPPGLSYVHMYVHRYFHIPNGEGGGSN